MVVAAILIGIIACIAPIAILVLIISAIVVFALNYFHVINLW